MIFPAKEKQFSNNSGFNMTVGNPESNTMWKDTCRGRGAVWKQSNQSVKQPNIKKENTNYEDIQISYLHNVVSVENPTRMAAIPVFPYCALHLFRDTREQK